MESYGRVEAWMEVSGELYVRAALPLGKDPHPRFPLDRRLTGPQSRSESCDKEKKPLSLLGIEPRMSNLYPVVTPT